MKSSPPPETITPLHEWILLSLLSVFVFLLYSNTLHGEFLLDDLRLIPRNPQIQLTELSLDNLLKVASTTRPVAMVSFALNYYFHQYEVVGYHIVNILIHIITGIILYFFIKTTINLPVNNSKYSVGKYLPIIIVLVWLVNPLHTQSVSYIIQRMNSLSALFYMLSMLSYAKARLSTKLPAQILLFILCALSGVLALGSKEHAVMLPFFIILYEWFFFQKCELQWAKKTLLYGIGFLVLVSVILYFHPEILPTGIIKKGYVPYDFTMGQRMLTEARVVLLYISLLVFPLPSRLNLDYDFPISYSLLQPPTTFLSIGIVLFLIVSAAYASRKEPLLAYCVFWFFGNLAIESSFIPLDLIFEHRTYLPSMLFMLGLIILLDRMCNNFRFKVALLVLVLFSCSFWTVQRNYVWNSALNMMVDSAEKSPGKARPAYNVACEFAKQGDVDRAIYWLKKSVSQKDFTRWDLLKHDRDLQNIRSSKEFQLFFQEVIPKKERN